MNEKQKQLIPESKICLPELHQYILTRFIADAKKVVSNAFENPFDINGRFLTADEMYSNISLAFDALLEIYSCKEEYI